MASKRRGYDEDLAPLRPQTNSLGYVILWWVRDTVDQTGTALETHLASLSLDADGDGQALAMTDGLLLLRAMLGLTGDALTQGATNASHPSVRNAQQILTWIENTHGVACLP